MYRLELFGSASIDGPAGPLIGRAVQRRRLGLLALVAMSRRSGIPRDRLAGYLWPDSDPERARHQLSDSIYRINQAVGGEALIAAGDSLRLNTERLPCDAWEFADAVEARDWRRAVELHSAPFLDGFYLSGAGDLEQWVAAQRERLARQRNAALESLADAAEAEGDHHAAVSWWRQLATYDPYSSRNALRLVRALERTGDRAPALQHARAHMALLEQDIGVAPDAELVAFVSELRAVPAAAVPTGARLAVAVLPFVNLSADPDNEYFADGITEDVIAQLSKVGALSVTSRTSVMSFKERGDSLKRIAAALGVSAIVDGSVRRVGDRVRIVATLIDAATDGHLWAETYDRQLTDIFAIQSDVALTIAAALRAELSPEERGRIRRQPTASIAAYELYLKGRSQLVAFTRESLVRAIEFFELALELDPAYALAHANIAIAYAELSDGGLMAAEAARPRAMEAAQRALALDPSSSEAHTAVGYIKSLWEFDWEGSEAAFRRALELSPSNADACDFYGRMCRAVGRFDEALELMRRAQQLDPLTHLTDVANALMRAGRHEEAEQEAARAVEKKPEHARAHATLGWTLIKLGRTGEGVAALERAVALEPQSTQWLAQLGQAKAMTGESDAARAILHQLEERAAAGFVSPYHLAFVHTGLGEHERAIDLLEESLARGSGSIHGIRGSTLLAPLQSNPRFRALINRMKSVRPGDLPP